MGKEVKLAVVVWKTFNGEYVSTIHSVAHKCLIRDDRLCNLQLLTKKELGRVTGGKTKKAKGIYKVDQKERIIFDYYGSSREAGAQNFCSHQTILDSCNGKYKNNVTGYQFVWANKVDNEVLKSGMKAWRWEHEEE